MGAGPGAGARAAAGRCLEGASPVEAWAGISLDRSIAKRYEHLPRRWVHRCVNGVIERTFSWLGQNRRLSKDYEYLTDTSEILIYIAMARLMLRRLTGDPSAQPGRKRPQKRPKVLSNEAQMTLQTGT